MADIKLFALKNQKAKQVRKINIQLEKQIQKICEENLEEFFGIKFLAAEYSTGNKHGGRIDSLGIDENNNPVIVEYKLSCNENIINQGLFYLDWLLDHKANFEMLVIDKIGKKLEVDWSNPRLLCIAQDFTKYDDHAISQINRNIELIRYRIFEKDMIVFEQASSTVQKSSTVNSSSAEKAKKYCGISDYMKSCNKKMLELLEEIEEYIFSLGDDVIKKELKYYFAYSRIQNFVCLEIHPKDQKIVIYVKVNYADIENKNENIRDVSNIGHYGTGDTEIIIKNSEDLNFAKELIKKSYEIS